jgi:hypothetical protein
VSAFGFPGRKQTFLDPQLHGTDGDAKPGGRFAGGAKGFLDGHQMCLILIAINN